MGGTIEPTRVRIEADAELTPEETRAIHAALEQYAATRGGDVSELDATAPWARAARMWAARGEDRPHGGGRDEWQAARDRRRRTGEATT
jgi:hypothetical protein